MVMVSKEIGVSPRAIVGRIEINRNCVNKLGGVMLIFGINVGMQKLRNQMGTRLSSILK